jgi:hypothetical protein
MIILNKIINKLHKTILIVIFNKKSSNVTADFPSFYLFNF